MKAMEAIPAAAGQCENDPNDRPIGFADRNAGDGRDMSAPAAAPLPGSQGCAD
jgi:hypothetical protein